MEPVLLIPGLLCSAEIFGPQIRALWPIAPVTVANTLRGDTVSQIASSILATAPPTFALGAISMGGYIALEIMRQAPERVTRLALLDTSARPDTAEQTAGRRAMIEQARQSADLTAFATDALGAILHPSNRDDPAIRAINARMAADVGLEGFARQTDAAIARVDSRPFLGAISVPTLVLVGDSDPLTPPDRSGEIVAAIAGSKLVVVPECGHGSTLERPEALNAALRAWMADAP